MQFTSPEFARSVLDAAPDAMIIIDEAGVVRFANRQASVLFGYEHDEIVGRTVEQLMPERFRMGHVAHRSAYAKQPRLRAMGQGLSLFGQRRDGIEFPVEISLSPMRDQNRAFVAAAIRDVTDRKRIEADLRFAQETSEKARQSADHLRDVADQARESADRANLAKSRFLATASHDLRQPLQTLAMLGGALQRMMTGSDASEILSQQAHAIAAMSRLLNALLDISKLEAGTVRPEPADIRVAALFDGLRRDFAGIAADKGLDLQIESSDESVHTDPGLLEQIMKNLVSNALKYTRRGRVVLRCIRLDASLRIDVLDTGIGIPADQIAYIYDEFFQVGVPANSSRDGYGLGLSIVQRLVKLLNLRLEVTSEVGKGSVFSLIVPCGSSQPGAATPGHPSPSVQAAPSRKRHVLLVEDDPGVRNATRMLLRVEGYAVTGVATLAEAIASTQEAGAPDLLITDYHLADGELGTEVIAAVRRHVGAEVKAVLITGDTSAAVRAIANDPHLRIINKPVNADELLGQLRTLCAD